MHTLLIVLIAYGGLGLISAIIPASVIEADLNEINQLSKDFHQVSPDIARQFTEATCQMISQCCPQMQSKFASMSLSGKTDTILEQCFGRKDSSTALSKLMSCSPFVKITTLAKNSQFSKYATIVSKKAPQNADDMKLTLAACSEQEIQSVACDWNPTDLQNSCQRKVLQTLAQQGDQVYKNKVQQTKDGYMKLTNELKNAF
jgi:hypothetical protein